MRLIKAKLISPPCQLQQPPHHLRCSEQTGICRFLFASVWIVRSRSLKIISNPKNEGKVSIFLYPKMDQPIMLKTEPPFLYDKGSTVFLNYFSAWLVRSDPRDQSRCTSRSTSQYSTKWATVALPRVHRTFYWGTLLQFWENRTIFFFCSIDYLLGFANILRKMYNYSQNVKSF